MLMKKYRVILIRTVLLFCEITLFAIGNGVTAQDIPFKSNITIQGPSNAAKPWVFWYWMYGRYLKKIAIPLST